jgi:Domain of unknown function (DUF5710)/SNF2-related domain
MPRRSISETQTGSLREEQIERVVVVAVISAWSIRPPSGEAPLAHEGSYQERSLKSYSLKRRKCHYNQHRLWGARAAAIPRLFRMIYLEITYAQKDEAKPFGARWDRKEKLWYFPGDVLPMELEHFRPANAPQGAVEKIILDIPFSNRDIAARAGVRWDSEIKACFFERRPGQALPVELEGFEPKRFSWEEKIQRELNGGAFSTVPGEKSITLRPHQLGAVEAIFSAYKNGYPGFLLADDVGLGKTFAAWAGILKIVESSHEKWKILIVCPLGVVANWRSSIQWMGTNRGVDEVVILNYERLGKIFEAKPRNGARKLSKRDLARRGAASEEFDIVLFDESHALINLTSLRAKFSVKLYGSAKLIFWLSATAGQNPLELGYLAPILAKKTGDRALTTNGVLITFPGFRGANSEPGLGQVARRKRKRFTSFCLILTPTA